MNKDALRNYFFRLDYPVVLTLLPCAIWVSIGLWVCYITSSGTVEIIAVLFPPFIIFLSYILAKRHKLLGGLILLIEGTSLMYICINNLSVSQNIIFQALFVLPLVIASLLFLSSINIAKPLTYVKNL